MIHSIPYVYILTDRETGKKYIGSRYAKGCEPDDLGVKYFTSSAVVKPLFQRDPNRFEKQIIAVADPEYVIFLEKKLIDFHDAVVSEHFYNRTSGKAIHPEDVRAGALKEHAKRPASLYASIVKQMHVKTTRAQRAAAGRAQIDSLSAPQLDAKMEKMRASITAEGRIRSVEAMASANTKESLSAAGKIGGKLGGPKGCKTTNSQRWKCTQCGMVSLPGPLGKHQNRAGHSGKERLI